ncbi:SRJ-4 protein [Aphelenchoides avenae]|nr:SRJ-4 protein [Aphelenchus avenae]
MFSKRPTSPLHHQPVVETVVNTLSIIFNSLLLYLIANHSSFGTPIYQILLAIDATLDLVLSIVALFSQTVVITGDGYLIYITNGFFAGWSHRLDMFLNFAWLWILHINMMWIPVQFVYRYTFICLRENKEKARKINALTALGTITWVCVGFVVCWIYSHREKGFQEQGRHVLAVNEWDVSDYTITVGSKLSEWMLQLYLVMWFCTCNFAISIVAIVEVLITRYFSRIGNNSHQSTKKLHKDFHRALLAMAITPLVTTTGPVLYIIIATMIELSPGPVQCFIASGITSITLFNPLTTMLAMRCYRNVVFKPCMPKNARIDPNMTRASEFSVASTALTRPAVVSSDTLQAEAPEAEAP